MGKIIPPMEHLNPNDLLIYARVADAGSFSKAAERLGLPKSTVSRRVALLEEQLGERLMVRSTRQSTFTEFGLQLLEHARQVAAEVDAVADLSERRHAQPTGRLRVSMPGEIAVLLLSDMLSRYVAQFPGVSLELDLSPRRVDILAESFDLALRFGDLADDATLTARRLANLSNGLYASPGYLAQHGTPQTPQDLMQHKSLVFLRRNNEPLEWTLQKDGVTWRGLPPSIIAANSPALLIRMAVANCGLVAVSQRLAQARLDSGELQRILPEWCVPPIAAWAVFPGRRLLQPKTRAFIEMSQAALSETLPAHCDTGRLQSA